MILASPFCFSEDWIVHGKTYHNVMVTDVNASAVSITSQDGTAQPVATKIPVSALPPERVAKLSADMQELKLEMALEIKSEGGGPRSLHIEYEKERPDAVKQLSQHPLKMDGIILYGDNYIYVVRLVGSPHQSGSTNSMSGSGDLDVIDSSNLIPDGTGWKCLFLPSPNRAFSPNQKINITVYPAGGAPLDGKTYPCFTDDANWAYTITHQR